MSTVNPFRKKLPEVDSGQGLRRSLSFWDLTFMGIGHMIGAGIFVLTGIAAATQAGPAVILSYLLAGIACVFVAFAYAELAASVGGCGGSYGYAYALFGELVAWIVGWNGVFNTGVAVAAIANGWSGYFANGLSSAGIQVPQLLTKGPFAGGLVNLPAATIILVLMLALFYGSAKHSARLNTAILSTKLAALAIFIGVALFYVRPGLWESFLPYGWFSYTADGRTVGVLAGAAVVFFAYNGFQTVPMAVEEARNPRRDVPLATLAALGISAALYITVSGLLTLIAPYAELNVSSPMAFALLQLGMNWGSALVAVGVIVGLTSTMLMAYYNLIRFVFAMARDDLLPTFLGRLHARTQIPATATIVSGIIMAALAGLVPLGVLAQITSVSALAEFVFVCLGVVVLRLARPDISRPFKAPGGILLPLLGVFACAALIAFLPPMILILFVLWLAAGFIVYFGRAALPRSADRKPA